MFKTQNISLNSYGTALISAAGLPNNANAAPKEKTFWENISSALKPEIKNPLTREVTYHVVRGGQWQLISKTIKI